MEKVIYIGMVRDEFSRKKTRKPFTLICGCPDAQEGTDEFCEKLSFGPKRVRLTIGKICNEGNCEDQINKLSIEICSETKYMDEAAVVTQSLDVEELEICISELDKFGNLNSFDLGDTFNGVISKSKHKIKIEFNYRECCISNDEIINKLRNNLMVTFFKVFNSEEECIKRKQN